MPFSEISAGESLKDAYQILPHREKQPHPATEIEFYAIGGVEKRQVAINVNCANAAHQENGTAGKGLAQRAGGIKDGQDERMR